MLKLEDEEVGLHYGFDDEVGILMLVSELMSKISQLQVAFNTQASSQWDSLCRLFV